MDPLVPLSSILLTQTSQVNTNIIVILILIILSAFFSASETAFSNCNKIRIKLKAEDGNKNAKLILNILENYDKSLITILIGNNVVNLTASSLATIVSLSLFQTEGIATVVSTIVMTIVVFIFGEILPKNIAKANADKIVAAFAYPIKFLMIIFTPISIIFILLSSLCKKLFASKEEEPEITEDDLQNIVEAIEEEGVIDEEESDLIQSAIEFDSIVVKEIFTPRKKIFAINIRDEREDIINTLLNNTTFSRIPIYDGSLDNIIGILHVRKFLKEYMMDKDIDIKSVLIEPYYVKSNIKLDDMLDGFSQHKTHIAIVVNNNDRTIGMVTMDDVLEELIGEQKQPKGSDTNVG